VMAGLGKDQITTSCLGFGNGYNEDLMATLASATNGQFYDANSSDKLPEIFAAELEGLQALAVQNLRVRLRRLDFCDAIEVLSDYPTMNAPDGSLEISAGGMISEEVRTLVVALEVPPLPLIAGGKPAADLEGERLIEVEILYDSLDANQVASHQWKQVVRVLAVQDEKDVQTNAEVIGIVSTQQTGRTLGEAISDADQGHVDEAKARLLAAILRLKGYPPSAATEEGLRVLQQFLDRLEEMGAWSVRERKSARYHSHYLRKMSSAQHWSGEEEAPSFNRPRRPRRPDNEPPAPDPKEK
jgi:Ca-activated chloride channel homolog